MEEALDVLLGEDTAGRNLEEKEQEPKAEPEELTSKPVNKLEGEQASRLGEEPASKPENKKDNLTASELTNELDVEKVSEEASDMDNRLIVEPNSLPASEQTEEIAATLDSYHASSTTRKRVIQPDIKPDNRMVVKPVNEIDGEIEIEIDSEQVRQPTRKPVSQLTRKANNSPTKMLSNDQSIKLKKALPRKKSRPVDPFLEVIAAQLELYLEEPGTHERVSVGGRLPRRLWELVELYCTYSKIQMQHFLEEAVVEKLKKELGITDQLIDGGKEEN
ncbi:hypothetical protein V3F56_03385 [Moorellaceae bacterium AZ2]